MNPLLQFNQTVDFNAIKVEHFEPAVDQCIFENKQNLEKCLALQDKTWHNFVEPLEEAEDKLSQVWAIISHLESVKAVDEIRAAYKICLQKITEYSTEMGQNVALYQGYQAVHDRADFKQLSVPQQKLIRDALRDFKLSGVSLSDEKKKDYTALSHTLSKLKNKFSDNVLDASQAWHLQVEDEAKLKGVPADAIAAAKALAEEKKQTGFLFSLDHAPYLAIMTYCEDRSLRQEMYTAYTTRASDEGPAANQFDNTAVMHDILIAREKLAHLLDFESYAALSLATKMATSTDEVLAFLKDLANKAKTAGIKEKQALCLYAKETFGQDDLASWDIAFYSEKLKQDRYGFNEQDTRPYFELDHVLNGLFEIVEKLFGIQVKEILGRSVPSPDVRVYEVYEGTLKKGELYADFFARPLKSDGAWMHDARSRKHLAGAELQFPIAYLNTNFQKPAANHPCLLLHYEVETLFHEFGHCLQHVLTVIDYPSIAGIQGIEWDAVELPSQFLENWCWEEAALNIFAKHYETRAVMPTALLNKMKAAKNFQSALSLLRQIEFSLLDFYLHSAPAETVNVLETSKRVRDEVAVLIPPAFTRSPHSFSHIFAGGYAAGYYSYKWAELLSCDAFSLFEERGIFDKASGKAFKQAILEPGASRDAMTAFIEFRGRKPSILPLLKHSGLTV